jgi:hypothetical protein
MATGKYREIDKFDRLLGALADLPDVTKVKPSTIVTHASAARGGCAMTWSSTHNYPDC